MSPFSHPSDYLHMGGKHISDDQPSWVQICDYGLNTKGFSISLFEIVDQNVVLEKTVTVEELEPFHLMHLIYLFTQLKRSKWKCWMLILDTQKLAFVSLNGDLDKWNFSGIM